MVELVIFVLMGLSTLAGGVTVVLARNPVRSAMGMLASLVSLAVIYVVNLAHLVAAVQVVVYAGAVLTLFLFVIMFIGVDRAEDTSETIPQHRKLVAGLALVVAAGAAVLVWRGRFSWTPTAPESVPIPNGTVQALGGELFTTWVLGTEVTAVLLTIAAVGAIALAFHRRSGKASAEK